MCGAPTDEVIGVGPGWVDRCVVVAVVLGAIGITFAMINVVGGFLVTDRMLKMFGRK